MIGFSGYSIRLAFRTWFICSIWCVSLGQSFTVVYGGPLAEHGTGVVLNDTAVLVGTRTFETGNYRARLDLRDLDGSSIIETELDLMGTLFLQGMTPIPGGGAFLVGSHIAPDAHEHDGLLIRVGSDNSISWVSHMDVPGDQQYYGVTALDDGGAMVCGVSDTSNGHDILVARFDLTGALLWSVTEDGGLDDEAYAIASDATGVVITGRQMNFGGTSDVVFMRFAMDGTLEWASGWGGSENEIGRALVRTTDGNFLMAGTTESYGAFDQTENRFKKHVFLYAFNAVGDTLWTRAIGDTLFERNVFCMDLAPNGDLLIGGERYVTTGTSDAMIQRLSSQGVLIWEHTIDEGKEEKLLDIHALGDGLIATGWSFDDAGCKVLLLRRDEMGL
ncbi:MAG: hypothetical protein IPI00_04615 [Flavobacteriales bacterium]|nr:hypothetical protein [Flavobacteriales bacterium]